MVYLLIYVFILRLGLSIGLVALELSYVDQAGFKLKRDPPFSFLFRFSNETGPCL